MQLTQPLGVNAGDIVSGSVAFKVNNDHSYDIVVVAALEGTPHVSGATYNLADQ